MVETPISEQIKNLIEADAVDFDNNAATSFNGSTIRDYLRALQTRIDQLVQGGK